MKWIIPDDQRHNNGLFFAIGGDGPRRPWPLYQDLACPKCMKIREDVALARGIDPGFTVQLSGDICLTDDGVHVFSTRTREFFASNGITGLNFVSIPNEPRYVLALPTVFVPVPRTYGMLRYEKACPECGRWRWIGVGSEPMMLPVPEDELVVFSPDVWCEDGFARIATLLCSEKVGQLLLDGKRRRRLQRFEVQDLPAGYRDDLVIPGPCSQCSGTGICYCLRKGARSAEGCVRCGGSGECHVCKGQGKR
jgi:hypothetical protein